MSELAIIPKGALLIRNGIIADVGPASRVENLAGARRAREIDATGRVVMPAFVDADVALVTPTSPPAYSGELPEPSGAIRLMSKRRVLTRASVQCLECARYGCLTVGAHTRWATDIQNIAKILRAHQGLQGKPLRIRSIFSPTVPPEYAKDPARMLELLTSKWLPAVKAKRLSAVVELTVPEPESGLDPSILHAVATAAASLNFTIRIRSASRLDRVHLQLALAAGAIGIVAPLDASTSFAGPLSAVGCIRVVPASEAFDDPVNAAFAIRNAIDEGAAIALASSYRTTAAASLNFQHLLHLAVYQLGLTAAEAITATTWNPACSLRLSHVAGSLEPGKPADLLMVEVPDYRELPRRAGHRDVSLVMRLGQVLLRSAPLSVD